MRRLTEQEKSKYMTDEEYDEATKAIVKRVIHYLSLIAVFGVGFILAGLCVAAVMMTFYGLVELYQRLFS